MIPELCRTTKSRRILSQDNNIDTVTIGGKGDITVGGVIFHTVVLSSRLDRGWIIPLLNFSPDRRTESTTSIVLNIVRTSSTITVKCTVSKGLRQAYRPRDWLIKQDEVITILGVIHPDWMHPNSLGRRTGRPGFGRPKVDLTMAIRIALQDSQLLIVIHLTIRGGTHLEIPNNAETTRFQRIIRQERDIAIGSIGSGGSRGGQAEQVTEHFLGGRRTVRIRPVIAVLNDHNTERNGDLNGR